ncbi:unnamed protein product, partial [Mesorhabditis belari]|uniref:Phosphorylase b kinase regulatory subunit n=1 Tax=Mesorhabditis belari TaxID=2138241 RepID=A0AAF3JBG0_9BILA
MASVSLSRRRQRPTGSNLKLRRLTQAYLAPLRNVSPSQASVVSKMDQIYELVEYLVLDEQSVTSGLFPRYSKDKDVGYVKDSIYAALACWACSIAYKRLDDDRGRETELRQTAVKTMRGILFSWMQQAEMLNKFKSNNSVTFALHSRFDLQTGMTLTTPNDKHYGHLQMDLVALFILAMVQMIVAGEKVIYTQHEVQFVQNLVFYIERTYRTPDFGIWERGTRYNRGTPELHASSVGMVKAALEAVNGFNVFGSCGTSSSVIYVDIDGHNRNRTTFETIIPRESASKTTDASLLLTVGWPAFATHDSKLFNQSVEKVVKHLEGKFGFKRFLRDGYRTEIEDASRVYYHEHETSHFHNVESQFPMFVAVMYITAVIRGESTIAERYWEKLQTLLMDDEDVPGGKLLPECYVVDELSYRQEKATPNSTELYPQNPQEFGHHVWSNSIYVIALLLHESLLHPGDIDPLNRHLPASHRPKIFNKHSAFQGSMEGDPVVQIALIAESARLQMTLSTYGISTQTPHEVEPVQIWPSWRLVKVFECLGKDEKLKIDGRPPRPFGPLSTSKVYRVFGDTVLCYPLLFEVADFYVASDPAVLIDDIKREIEFIARRWKLSGRPTMCILLREENVLGPYFDHMMDLLVQLKNGFVNGIRVRLGRVHQLLNSSCIEHVDFANSDDVEFDIGRLEEAEGPGDGIRSRQSLKEATDDETTKESDFHAMSDNDLYELLTRDETERLRGTAFAIAVLWKRHGPEFQVGHVTLHDRLERLYRVACQLRMWWLVRYCAGRLQKTVNSLAPSITNLLVRGKQVTVGVRSMREVTVSTPMAPSDLFSLLFSCCPSDEPQMACIQQELIIACADLIGQTPDSFSGVLTVRLAWLADAIQMLLSYVRTSELVGNSGKQETFYSPPTPTTTGIPNEIRKNSIYDLSPTVVKDVLSALLARKVWHLLTPLQTRRLNGALNRMPEGFYDRVWGILERADHGISIAHQLLPQQPTLSDMTKYELTFAYRIEQMMSQIAHPEYRQILVELLCIVATMLERNPEIHFGELLDCDEMIKKAFLIYASSTNIKNTEDLTPFYQLDNIAMNTSTATFLTKAVVEHVLQGRHLSRPIDIFQSPRRHESSASTKETLESPINEAERCKVQ